jgi:hypothetical protein
VANESQGAAGIPRHHSLISALNEVDSAASWVGAPIAANGRAQLEVIKKR